MCTTELKPTIKFNLTYDQVILNFKLIGKTFSGYISYQRIYLTLQIFYKYLICGWNYYIRLIPNYIIQ